MDRSTLEKKQLVELREIASTLELRGYKRMRKADLVDLIIGADPSGNGNGNASAGAATTSDDTTPATSSNGSSSDDDGDGGVKHKAVDHRAASGGARPRSRRRDDGSSDADDQDGGNGAPEGTSGSDDSKGGSGGGSGGNRDDQDTRNRGKGGQDDKNDNNDRGGKDTRNQGGGQKGKQGGGNDNDGGGRRNKNRRRKGRGSGGNQGGNDHANAEVREGVLDLLPEGYGFLRTTSYLTGEKDVYVSQNFVRRFDLRRGDLVKGPIRHNNRGNDKFPALARVDEIEGMTVEEHKAQHRPRFKDLTPLFPNERLRLETEEKAPIAMRIMDLMSPIGKGQRGLIVSPPKAGKTTILKQLARSIETNNPEVHLMVLLVDERPEEVTDFERSVKGEVISSTFDRPADDHTQVAELASERAQRLVERGRDVVILLDSITRLGRAYNLAAPASGRILSGGIDSAALYPPKRFFGAARNIEDGGSLTILASALIETGSKMDDVIFEEFKGTGNMELRLDRRMEQKRIFPAIDVQSSGTRREELLLGKGELEIVWKLRRLLAQMDTGAALELLIDKLKATRSNQQFLQAIANSNIG
jgi:transcription termination factor Rho